MKLRYFLSITRLIFLSLFVTQINSLCAMEKNSTSEKQIGLQERLEFSFSQGNYEEFEKILNSEEIKQLEVVDKKTIFDALAIQASVQKKDEKLTFIQYATCMNNKELVTLLTRSGFSADHFHSLKQTALTIASSNGLTDIAQALINAKADVNIMTYVGTNSLHLAAYNGQADTLNLLIQNGANLEVQELKELKTPLIIAAEQNRLECLKCLIAAGSCLNQTNNSGDTALHLAASAGHYEIVQELIFAGASIDTLNYNKETPLTAAVNSALILDSIARLDLPAKISYLNDIYKGDTFRINDYLNTLKKTNIPTVKLLIDAGAFVDTPDKKGVSPLESAIKQKNIVLVKLLLEGNADVTIKTTQGGSLIDLVSSGTGADLIIRKMLLGAAEQSIFNKVTEANNVIKQLLEEEAADIKDNNKKKSKSKKKKPKNTTGSSTGTNFASTQEDLIKSHTEIDDETDQKQSSVQVEKVTVDTIKIIEKESLDDITHNADSSITYEKVADYQEALQHVDDQKVSITLPNGISINFTFRQSDANAPRVHFSDDSLRALKNFFANHDQSLCGLDHSKESQKIQRMILIAPRVRSFFPNFIRRNQECIKAVKADFKKTSLKISADETDNESIEDLLSNAKCAHTIDHACTIKLIIYALLHGQTYLSVARQEPGKDPRLLVVAPIEHKIFSQLSEKQPQLSERKNFLTLCFKVTRNGLIKHCYHCCVAKNHPGKKTYALEPVAVEGKIDENKNSLNLSFNQLDDLNKAQVNLYKQVASTSSSSGVN